MIIMAVSFVVPANASSFRAMPLKLFLDHHSKTEVLRIVNEGDENVTVQISTKSWLQDVNGKDVYADTDDIVVFPKMATIAAHETRIFRVGYTGGEVSKELSYRLFAQELPVSTPGQSALRFALKLSLPVFVVPAEIKGEWSAQIAGIKQESVQVTVMNSSNIHLLVNKIKAVGVDSHGVEVFNQEVSGWYTLGGGARSYKLPVPYQQCLKTAQVNVEIESRSGKKQLMLPVSKSMCSSKP